MVSASDAKTQDFEDRPAQVWPEITGRTALVTGGGRGIGRGIARALAAAGASVAIADRHADDARRTESEIRDEHGAAASYEADVSAPDQVASLVNSVTSRFGRIDFLINNAGIAHVDPLLSLPLDTWRSVFSVNVEGPLLLVQAAAKIMQSQPPDPVTGCRGKVVNIGSPAAEEGRPLLAAYGASKAALNHLSKSCALVLGASDIPVTVVYPGNVLDGMLGHLLQPLAEARGVSYQELVDERAGEDPSGALQPVEQVAQTVVFALRAKGLVLNAKVIYSYARVAQL
jgi:NAD(P)-dependent dehydrogenase (short-subunit alcohol dehydrogenase family)